ncbi:hypothetical protein BCR35DRAFT_302814 [Leucosporidium creatinivorum]|uniref:Uncharacterized protein n=1 Tax=Leucosporidium creatinivorum TaxID=106004 RepID=A0A1Y2FRK7_9BASI|nr:hypothetical protein BCR35DRAFT_302814 [Leucosporidium creatinivorum]
MAPTLPAELIKHILELVYEDVRPVHRSPLLDPWSFGFDGAFLFTFRPILLVSKAFHALALPFLVRDLATYMVPSTQSKAFNFIQKHSLGSHVQILLGNQGDLTSEQKVNLFRACPNVRTLYLLSPLPLDLQVPSTITTLHLRGFPYFDRYAAFTLADSLPQLKRLALFELKNVVTHPFPLSSCWRLEELAIQTVPPEMEAQVLAWIADSSSSLRVFSLTTPSFYKSASTHQKDTLSPSALIPELSSVLPSLRWLHLGAEGSLPVGCEILGEETLPSWEVLEIAVDEDSVDQLLDLSSTIRRVVLTITSENFEFTRTSTVVRTLKAFVKTHPRLELFSIDLGDDTSPEDGWADGLTEECKKRGVVFACNDSAVWDAEGAQEFKAESTSTDDSDSDAHSTGTEEGFDYDAEDDAVWANLWSEEKRLAMGLASDLDDTGEATLHAPTADRNSADSNSVVKAKESKEIEREKNTTTAADSPST